MSYNILDVVKDALTGNLKFVDAKVFADRQQICEPCDVRNTLLNTCSICNCFIPAKAKLQESTCPMEKW